MNKEKIIAEINRLKTEKPDGWKRDVRSWIRVLQKSESRFDQHEYNGNEMNGRKGLPLRSPPV